MTLYPQAQASIGAQVKVPLTVDRLGEARQSMVDAVAAECGTGPEIESVQDVDAGGVPARLYVPFRGAPFRDVPFRDVPFRDGAVPVVVYLHGGGWVMGGLATHDPLCRLLADRSGCAVFAVGYRLSPEHPYPAAFDDVERAVGWLRETGASRYGLDPTRLAVAGDSAGGHLTAVTARRARDRGEHYAYQVLACPVIDPEMRYPDLDAYGLDRDEMRFFWDAFAPPGRVDRSDPDLAPLNADLTGLPPALVITAEYDILRDEGEAYAAALAAAGVSTVAVRYPGLNHNFQRKLALFDAAPLAVGQIAEAVRRAL
jgi:acetyl esterase/lipase